MRFIKITGLCLVAMVTMSMALAASASAAPHWLVCLAAHSESTRTKWSTNQCSTAQAGGGWEWSEPKTTERVVSHASLTLVAEQLSVKVKVNCSGKDEGWIGPNGKAETTSITEIQCTAGENCEVLEKAAEPVNLPWNSELAETEGKIHATVRGTGAGNPGWRAKCKVPFKGPTENECTSNEGLLVLVNKNTPGNGAALLVLGEFTNKPKANCTSTGNGSGEVLGSTAFLLASGAALAVSK